MASDERRAASGNNVRSFCQRQKMCLVHCVVSQQTFQSVTKPSNNQFFTHKFSSLLSNHSRRLSEAISLSAAPFSLIQLLSIFNYCHSRLKESQCGYTRTKLIINYAEERREREKNAEKYTRLSPFSVRMHSIGDSTKCNSKKEKRKTRRPLFPFFRSASRRQNVFD